MRFKISKYIAFIRVSLRSHLKYPANCIFQVLPPLIRIWILATLYSLVELRVSGTNHGLSTGQIVWAVGICQIVGSSAVNIDQQIQVEVRSGAVAYWLNRPINYVVYHLLNYLGRSIAILAIGAIFGIPLIYLLVGSIKISWLQLIWAVGLVLLGLLLFFLQVAAIGLCSFWIENTDPIRWVYQKAWIALGGMIIPIAILPNWLRHLVEFLPFPYLFQNGAAIISNYQFESALKATFAALAWILISVVLVAFIYQRGVRNVAINGG